MYFNICNNGIRLTTRAIYGYKKSPEDKRVWVIDDPAAEVVRKIFALFLSGCGAQKIANTLEEEKVLRAESTQKDLVKRINSSCSIVENFPEVSEITPEVVSIFIDKVLVYESKKTPGKQKKTPKIKVLFNGIGELD